MSIGHYADEYEVAISDKPELKDIMKVIILQYNYI